MWRLTQIGALVDIAYILNTASRIAAGDVPYSEFRLAHPPLTFLVQAALIRVFGPQYLIHVAYAAVMGGLATVLAYQIARRLLEGVVGEPRFFAAILSIPLVPLGIYSIFPHPHYDPDAGFAVLVAILATLVARERGTALAWSIAGATLVIPLFIKQNIGGAFLPVVLVAIALDALHRPDGRRTFVWCAVGVIGALAVALVSIQLVAGLGAYFQWTVLYALAERGVVADRLGPLVNPWLVGAGVLIPLAGVAAARLPGPAGPALLGLAAGLPLAVIAAAGFPLVWVPLGIGGAAIGVAAALRRRFDLEVILPVVCLVTLTGTLQSQGIPGSTFGTFPLLIVCVAGLVRGLHRLTLDARAPRLLVAIIAVVLLLAGTRYTVRNDRMLFADANNAGPVQRSAVASLAGMSARGPYVAEVDELISWVRANVREGEGITFIPGEDPVYFALGLRPGLPVVQYINGSLPYTPEELARIADANDLRWVIVKERLQLTVPRIPEADRARDALIGDAEVVEVMGPYRIYRRP